MLVADGAGWVRITADIARHRVNAETLRLRQSERPDPSYNIYGDKKRTRKYAKTVSFCTLTIGVAS